MLRSEAGRNPTTSSSIELIGELSTRSDDFRTRWAAHNVRFHRTGHKVLHHPVVGRLDLDFEAMEFPAHPGLTLLVYTAAAGTPTADGLKLLASWAASQPRVDANDAGSRSETITGSSVTHVLAIDQGTSGTKAVVVDEGARS